MAVSIAVISDMRGVDAKIGACPVIVAISAEASGKERWPLALGQSTLSAMNLPRRPEAIAPWKMANAA